MKALIITIFAFIITCLGAFYSYHQGKLMAESDRTKLMLLWPELDSMPTSDIAFIIGLAMTCRLSDRAHFSSEVVSCLREAADDPSALLPKGVRHDEAPAKLEALLSNT